MNAYIHITAHAIDRASLRAIEPWRSCSSEAAKRGLHSWLVWLCQVAIVPYGQKPITTQINVTVRGVGLVLHPREGGGVTLVTVLDPQNTKGHPKLAKTVGDKFGKRPAVKDRRRRLEAEEIE